MTITWWTVTLLLALTLSVRAAGWLPLAGPGTPVTGGKLLLADGASFLLLVDGTSKLCLAGGC